MSSTWRWIGGKGTVDPNAGNDPQNWILVSGTTNPNGTPSSGDTALVDTGTVDISTDSTFHGNTVELGQGATAAWSATLAFTGSTAGITFSNPTVDPGSIITTGPAGAAGSATIDSAGSFINQGSIVANDPFGGTFTVNIHQNGTSPGFFINYGEMIADAGNSMTISVGGTSELFNVGLLQANGGTLVVNASSAAIVGGFGPVQGIALITNGGTFETNNAYPSGFSGAFPTDNGSAPYFIFGDATPGDTLKIDHVKQFGGRILGFAQHDTIDIGTSLSVGKVAFDATAGVLALENASGTILASLGMSSGAFQDGTFDVSGTVANDITIVTTASDTFLTTDLVNSVWDNSTGSWQTKTSWSTGKEPDSTATPVIGLGASAPFTINTGATPVSTNSLSVVDHNATLQITSNTTVAPNFIQLIDGTIEVMGGHTLLASALRQFENGASLKVDAGANLKVDANAVLDLEGHLNTNLAANNGTLGIANGNTVALFINGTATVDGVLNAGSTASQTGGLISIGQNGQGTPGTMTVEGGGTVIDTYAHLSSDPTSNGALTLTGAGTSWTDGGDPSDTATTRGFILVGNDNQSPNGPLPPFEAPALLTVENKAALTEATYARIGNSADSAGSALIESGAIWTIGTAGTASFLNVGNNGSGTLAISGGTVDILNGNGTFDNNGTPFTNGLGVGIANNNGSDGTITVASGTLDIAAGGMGVGKGGHGVVDVQANGTVTLENNGFTIGQSIIAGVTATGTMFVEGSGALFTTGNGGGNVGLAGDGTLEVLNGGTVSLTGNNIFVGVSAAAMGFVEVAGTTTISPATFGTIQPAFIGFPALLTDTTNGMQIGEAGSGTLDVLTNGTVLLAGGINAATTAAASGTILVSGNGADLTTGSGVAIGEASAGFLTVEGGGLMQINSGGLALGGTGGGAVKNASGTVTVQGATTDVFGTPTFLGGTIAMTGNLNVWAGSTISVDGVSAVGVGTTGSLVAGEITVQGASSLIGNGLVEAKVLNNHSVVATTGGTLEITDTVNGIGALVLNAGAVMRLDNTLGPGQSVTFASGGPPTLILGQPSTSLTNPLNNVGIGDRIELGNGMTITAVNMLTPGTITNASTAEVVFHGSKGLTGTYDIISINFAADGSNQFTFGHDATTGDDFIQAATCFAVGTRISTERGEVAVENLCVGDHVHVVQSQRFAPVVWIGHRHIES